jgi:predicted aspartyl protease
VGQLYVPVILRNAREYVLARHGHLAVDQVHTYKTEHALIDTGALHVVLPPHVAEQLGLWRMGYTAATMANGTLVEGEVTEPL